MWLRSPVTGVLGEGGAGPDDDRPRPALQRFDLRQARRQGAGRRAGLVPRQRRRHPDRHPRPRRAARHSVRAQERQRRGRPSPSTRPGPGSRPNRPPCGGTPTARRGGTCAGTSGTRICPGWTGTACSSEYRPLLDRIRGAADFADLLWEVLGELGTSHAYVTAAGNGTRDDTPVGQLGADISRDADGRWVVDRILPGESSDPRARSPLEAPGVAASPGDELVAVDGQPVDPRRGPWPLLAGTAGKPVELTIRPQTPARGPAACRGRAAALGPAAPLPGLGGQPAPPGPRAQRRTARLPAHPGHDGRGLGALPPRPAHRDDAGRADLRRAREQRRAHLRAGGGEAGPAGRGLGPGPLPAAVQLPAGGAARRDGHAGRRVRRVRRRHRHRRGQAARPRPGGRHPDLGRRDRHRGPAGPGRRLHRHRAAVRVLLRRVRLGRGEPRRRPGRGGADHPGRRGRRPGHRSWRRRSSWPSTRWTSSRAPPCPRSPPARSSPAARCRPVPGRPSTMAQVPDDRRSRPAANAPDLGAHRHVLRRGHRA